MFSELPHDRRISRPVAAGMLASLAVGLASGGVAEFFDRDEWIAAVGQFTTADFTGFPHGMFVTDQYADLGVLFTDGNDSIYVNQSLFLNDGVGLDGNGDITVSFATPQVWIGADFPGLLTIELYRDGLLIHSGGFGFWRSRQLWRPHLDRVVRRRPSSVIRLVKS